MNFSTTTVAIWLLSLSTTNAFTTNHHTTPYTHQHAANVQSTTTSLSMLLKQDKFDAIITNKLSKKELGYDQRSGRFYELQSSKIDGPFASGSTTTATVEDVEEGERCEDEPVTYTDLLTKDAQKTPTWQQVDSSSVSESADELIANSKNNNSAESTTTTNNISDVPPMPSSNFQGMDLTGTTINGVQLTSSTETIKSKETRDAINKQFAIEDAENKARLDREKKKESEKSNKNSLQDVITNSGAVSAAAMATAAVNAAVSMKSLTAPDVQKSYISLDTNSNSNSAAIDEEGLPLVYDKDLIESYWKKERGALNQRWSYFVGKAVPFLTRLVTLFIKDGEINEREIPSLSKQARIDLQDLGPTFIKAGQMMSVRPDVLPQATLEELTKLQDAVIPFDTSIAVAQIEEELGGPLGQFFTSISEEPVAAASLAQVYVATLNDGNDTKVAIKVQRPQILSVVSKDLYVLRRAAEVFQGLVERFAPQQKTNYVALLNEWAIGFYTELDFVNEAKNQEKLRNSLIEKNIEGITVPKVYMDLCTRRILVSEWMDGKKLSECPKEEIAEITAVAQEAFLTQLFELGFFHADPHPGNILKLNNPTPEGHTVALLDCGLMASIDREDQDYMINAVIHLANKDYASLVDDFIKLNILPTDCDRAAIIPLMDKALTPYVKGGGAKKYEEELKKLYGMEEDMASQVGGFQAMTQDALTVLNDVPFSIPPYFAILGRAIVTLEGIALTGNEDYGIIMESYPFIARKLLAEGRPEIQQALQEVLFSVTDDDSSSGLKFNRLLALLNNASGAVGTQDGAAFVDLDQVPDDGLTMADGFKLLLSDDALSLRKLLEDEVENIADVLFRQITRKGMIEAVVAFTPPRPPTLPFLGDVLPQPPKVQLDDVPFPFLLPSEEGGNVPAVKVMTPNEFVDLIAPKLSRDEEIYAISIADAAEEFLGVDAANFLRGDGIISTQTAQLVLAAATTGLLGNSNLLSTPAAKNTLNTLSDLLQRLDRNSSSEMSVEDTLAEATSKLNDVEKERLDEIVTELTQRILQRVRTRVGAKA